MAGSLKQSVSMYTIVFELILIVAFGSNAVLSAISYVHISHVGTYCVAHVCFIVMRQEKRRPGNKASNDQYNMY